MHINLAYGTEQVPVDVPDNWINGRCYRPHPMGECTDVRAELIAALAGHDEPHSLASLGKGKKSCVIAIDTETPVLFEELLPALIEEIEDETDLHREQITVLLTNRVVDPFTPEIAEKLVPEDLRQSCLILVHDHLNRDLMVRLGESSKQYPLSINRYYRDAELKIVVGGVRPDPIWGFLGGRSVLVPGLCGRSTIRAVYRHSNVADPNSRFGNFRDNPFHQTAIEAMNAAGCDMAVSAVLADDNRIHRLFTGPAGPSHLAAMNYAREQMIVRVKEPMDIVITSAGGAPADSSLPHLIATLGAVQHVLKPEGTIVVSAAVTDGVDHPIFKAIREKGMGVREILSRLEEPDRFLPGQWMVQRLYGILQNHEIILFNKDLEEDVVWSLGLTPARDLNEAVMSAMENHGQRCKIVALPEGPRGIGEVGR